MPMSDCSAPLSRHQDSDWQNLFIIKIENLAFDKSVDVTNAGIMLSSGYARQTPHSPVGEKEYWFSLLCATCSSWLATGPPRNPLYKRIRTTVATNLLPGKVGLTTRLGNLSLVEPASHD